MRKLTPGEIKAYRELAEAAKKLRRAQQRAESRRAEKSDAGNGGQAALSKEGEGDA